MKNIQEKWSWQKGFNYWCRRTWDRILRDFGELPSIHEAHLQSHIFLPCQQIPTYVCLTNWELSRFGIFLHCKGGRRHAEPYHAPVFWTMLCWPCMTMPWSLPQELIVHRPFWQSQFSCNFSMFPWLWAKNIQHLVQQSGLTTDSVYPVKSQQWYRQYSKEKRLPNIYCTGNSRSIQTKSTGANRVSCSSFVEEPSSWLNYDDVRMIPSVHPSKLSKTICTYF